MCGIAGIFSSNKSDLISIQAMTDSLSHRGPDAEGVFNGKNIALGHRRLSIIDLDPRSHQPFFSHDKRFVVVFNGEIYNFKKIAKELSEKHNVSFKTTSDTEVLVEAFSIWGVECVHRFNGMFAFAIYDTQDGKLYLFRDRVGKKPLFYYQKNNTLVFASEIKALFQHQVIRQTREIDYSTLADFLQLGYIPHPKTFFKDIQKFPAGHYAIVTNDSFRIHSYWTTTDHISKKFTESEDSASQELKRLLDDAVSTRMVADVPVGVFLSGGIDSSIIASFAARHSKLKTFSIGFQENKFDESQYAMQVANHLGTEHQGYILQEREAVELVDEYIHHFDEPFADTSAIPTMLISRLARKEVTVALTGDGGDELFLGYGAYTWAERLKKPMWSTGRPLIREFMRMLPSSRWKRVAHLFDKVTPDHWRQHIFSQEQYFFTHQELTSLLMDPNHRNAMIYNDPGIEEMGEASQQALFDFDYYLPDDLLAKVDRASMKYGLECRSPLLDQGIVEFSLQLSDSLKKRGGTTKYLLRKVLFESVPASLFDRPKWGFSIPLGQWMRNELSYLIEGLTEEQLAKTKIFNPLFVASLVARFKAGEDYLYHRLWTIIILQRYFLKQI